MSDRDRGGLWWFVGPLMVFLAHFNAVYAVVAVGCLRLPHAVVYGMVAGLTAAAVGGLGVIAVRSWRRSDEDEAAGFLARAAVAAAGLSLVGVTMVTVSAVLSGGCP